MMTEDEMRCAVVAEAKSWLKTPYVDGQRCKGAGVDCGLLLIAVYANVGAIPDFDVGYYNPQHHMHSNDEVYLGYILERAHEIEGPPKPGDIVMFKFGRVFSHGAIVIGWPRVIHSLQPSGVTIENVERCTLGPRAMAKLQRKYFSLWL